MRMEKDDVFLEIILPKIFNNHIERIPKIFNELNIAKVEITLDENNNPIIVGKDNCMIIYKNKMLRKLSLKNCSEIIRNWVNTEAMDEDYEKFSELVSEAFTGEK